MRCLGRTRTPIWPLSDGIEIKDQSRDDIRRILLKFYIGCELQPSRVGVVVVLVGCSSRCCRRRRCREILKIRLQLSDMFGRM